MLKGASLRLPGVTQQHKRTSFALDVQIDQRAARRRRHESLATSMAAAVVVRVATPRRIVVPEEVVDRDSGRRAGWRRGR